MKRGITTGCARIRLGMSGTTKGDEAALQRLAEAGLLPLPHPAVPVSPDGSSGNLANSYRGALIGTAVGDALGRPAEGRPPWQLREHYGRLTDFEPWAGWAGGPKGAVTDDTQMTMSVAECLVANGGRINPVDLAKRFVMWLPDGRGKGRTCVQAVLNLEAGSPWYEAGISSAGNGAAMRAAPVGLAHLRNVDALRHDAALSALITHSDTMAVASAVAHAWLVARLAVTPVGGLEPEALVRDLCAVLSDISDPGATERNWQVRPGKSERPIRLVDRLAEVPEWLGRSVEHAGDWFYNGAFVLESLPMSLWHFLNAPDDAEEAIVNAVMGGYDADTVASMTGAYVGAYLGEDALPTRWTGQDLEFAADLRYLADQLLLLAGPEPTDT
jgi:ADP-ribosylglycohydrolase